VGLVLTGDSRRIPLLWRILTVNAAVITGAVAVLAFSPAQIPEPVNLRSSLVVLGGLALVLAANLFLLQRAVAPLRRLTELMRRVDPLRPGERIPASGGASDVAELTRAFNEMLERLETERRESTSRTLAAQETERLRLARELHDEIGQRLTAALLQLSRLANEAPGELRDSVEEVTETARLALQEVRTIAAQLRPVALDDLGLVSALGVLTEQVSEQAETQVDARLPRGLPELDEEAELVVYRVAQEALTNAVRHSDAERIELALEHADGRVRLVVRDDGRGLGGSEPGNGVKGMRERALLVGGRLALRSRAGGGAEVRLELPVT
jgi:two-component system, NarL family, sensor histidine kinase UhpB